MFGPRSSAWTLALSPPRFALSPLPRGSGVVPFCVFRQQVLEGDYPFPNPVRFSPVCFVWKNSDFLFPLDSLLSHSARNSLLICSVQAAAGEAQIHACSLPAWPWLPEDTIIPSLHGNPYPPSTPTHTVGCLREGGSRVHWPSLLPHGCFLPIFNAFSHSHFPPLFLLLNQDQLLSWPGMWCLTPPPSSAILQGWEELLQQFIRVPAGQLSPQPTKVLSKIPSATLLLFPQVLLLSLEEAVCCQGGW